MSEQPVTGHVLKSLDHRRAIVPAGTMAVVDEVSLGGFGWTPLYVAFLIYLIVIATSRIPIGTEAMAVALLALIFQRDRFRFPPLLKWFAAFLLWGCVGYVFSRFQANVSDALLEMFKVWLITLVAVNALRRPAQIQALMLLFLTCFALYPVRGTILNYLGGISHGGRVAWNYIYENPNDLAGFALLQISMACALFVSARTRWLRVTMFVAVLVLILVVLITASRGGMLGLATFLVVWWLREERKLRSLLVVGIIGIVTALAVPNQAWERLGGLKNALDLDNLQEVDPEGSAQNRFEILKVAWSLAVRNPVAGVGIGAYPLAHYAWACDRRSNSTTCGTRDTHNTYLNVAAEMGFIGLGLFMAILVSTVSYAERVRQHLRRSAPSVAHKLFFLELGLLAFSIAGIFGSYSKLTFLYVHLALIWAAAAASDGAGRSPTQSNNRLFQGNPDSADKLV